MIQEDRPLDKLELAKITELHRNLVTIPVPDSPNMANLTCIACGHWAPCPTTRLIVEVIKLREVDNRYSASLHE